MEQNKKAVPIYAPRGGETMRVAVLISGSGTNMLAIHDEQRRRERLGESGGVGRIECVFTNVPGCEGERRAGERGLSTASLSSKRFFEAMGLSPDDEEARDYYDAAAFALIESVTEPDLIVLAGYRRRLGRRVLQRYRNRVINLYPGDTLKPYLVRGVEASVQALRAGERTIKATVFLARYDERFGPAIVQSKPIELEGFTEEDAPAIAEKIRSEGEHMIFPFAVHELIAGGRVAVDGDEGGDEIWIDGAPMPKGGWQYG